MLSCKKLLIVIWIFSLTLLKAGGDLYPDSATQNISVLYPDESLATMYNKNKCMNSLHAKKIIIWDQPSSISGARKIGEISPGTITNVLERYENYYKVRNPLDGTVGWIRQKQAISLPWINSHKSCSDHVEASNKYLRQMEYYMITGDRKNGGLYTAAEKAQHAAIGVIKRCPFSIDLISDYACSLPFYSQIMHEEAKKY
jgi:hypothetical protein